MKEFKKRAAKLIDVKSIMTLLLTVVFCVMALCGVISGQEFLTIFTVIVGFYFGTQATKKAEETEAKPAAEPAATVEDVVTPDAEKPLNSAEQNDIHPPDVAATSK